MELATDFPSGLVRSPACTDEFVGYGPRLLFAFGKGGLRVVMTLDDRSWMRSEGPAPLKVLLQDAPN